MPTLQRLPFDAFVVAAAFLGDVAAFALGDGTIRLVRGPVADPVAAHKGAVLSAVRTQDGRALITGGDDGVVNLTDAAGTVTRLAERPRKWIEEVAAGPGGAVAFGAGKEATVRIAGGAEKTFTHARAVSGLAFAPKGMRLAVARYGGVSLWWATADAPATDLEWKGAHHAVTFAPDGRYVVTAMQENALHGWRIPEGTHMRMTGYPAKPKSISWSARGRYLASSGSESAVLWPFHSKDGPQGKPPLLLGERAGLVTRVACHPREEILALGYSDGAVALAPFDEREPKLVRPPDGSPVSALAWHDRGSLVAIGTEAGAAAVLDLTA